LTRQRGHSDDMPLERQIARLSARTAALETLVEQRAARVAVQAVQDHRLTLYGEERGVDVRRSVRLVPTQTPGHVLGVAPDQAAVDELVSSIKHGLEAKALTVEWVQSPTEVEWRKLDGPEWAHFRRALGSGDSQSSPMEGAKE
jgi:hypothetical protein